MDVPPNIVTVYNEQQITDVGYSMNNGRYPTSFTRKISTDVNQEEQGPDYKHQCQSVIPNSSRIDQLTENQVPKVLCSNPSSMSSSPIDHSYIPFVCGVPLREVEDVVDTFDLHVITEHNDYIKL